MMNNYGTPPLALVRGSGAEVWDADGRRYLDLLAGIAVNALGHAHPAVVEAVTAAGLHARHTSNLYITEPPLALAERLLELLGAPEAQVLFCNSGAEANEAAFKMARRTGRPKIIAAENAFHGRTMGALALTGQQPKRTPFEPMTPGRLARALRRRRRPRRGRRRRHRRGVPGTDPGRGGRGHPARRATWPRRGRSPRPGARCSCSTRCRPASAAPAPGSPTSAPASSRTWSRWPRASAAGCRSGPASASARPPTLLEPGQHGTTFGGNPVCCAAALAVLRHDRRPTACWSTSRCSARRSPPASRRWATRWSAASTGPAC